MVGKLEMNLFGCDLEGVKKVWLRVKDNRVILKEIWPHVGSVGNISLQFVFIQLVNTIKTKQFHY
jgi:hypothetical protein